MSSQNFYATLRAAFPTDLERIAVEAAAPDGTSLFYTWRDLDHASARMANLLASLGLPKCSRVVVQGDKSVEAMVLYLAILRAGHVFVPLHMACQTREFTDVVVDAQPAVVVCPPGNFGWVSKIAFTAGAQHVYTLRGDRTGSLLERAAHHSDHHLPALRNRDNLAAIVYPRGTIGRGKRTMLTHGKLVSRVCVLTGGERGDGLWADAQLADLAAGAFWRLAPRQQEGRSPVRQGQPGPCLAA